MTNLEIVLLIGLCSSLISLICAFYSYNILKKICKDLILMNTVLLQDMLKLSQIEQKDINPFEEFKGSKH